MCRSVPQIAVFSTSISTSLWPYSGTGTSPIQMPLAASRLISALIICGMSSCLRSGMDRAIIRRSGAAPRQPPRTIAGDGFPVRHRSPAARDLPDGPHRDGQDRARLRAGRTFSGRTGECRFGAGLSRPRHRRGQAGCRDTAASSARLDRPPRSLRTVFRGNVPRGRAGRDHRARQGAAAGGGHRPVFPRAGARAFRDADGRSGLARPAVGRSGSDRLAGPACKVGEARSRRGGALTALRASAGGRARLPYRVLKLALIPADRQRLRERIAARFDAMLAAGLLEEVRRLRARGDLQPGLPALRAVGYRQAWQHLAGGLDAREFRRRAIFATNQLAKRQLTWLRGELDARAFDPERADLAQAVARAVGLFLAKSV